MRKARPFHPPATRESFKDLLIFEERLKQNAERLQKQRRKYQGFLMSLIAVILYLAYLVLVQPSIYSLVHYSNVACLLVAATTLVLFFATGMYTDKIAYAYKFVPQANRALRPFNIYLNTRYQSRLSFLLLNPFRSRPPRAPASTSTPSLSRTSSGRSFASVASDASSAQHGDQTLSRQPSVSSLRSETSFRSTNALRSASPSPSSSPAPSPPPSPRMRVSPAPPIPEGAVTRAPPPPPAAPSSSRPAGVPIPPIPPAQNPRGELIFSNRVTPTFREGYERYRGEWERRRKENRELELERASRGSSRWWSWFGRGRVAAAAGASDSKMNAGGRDKSESDRRRGASGSATSSRLASRANSSERPPSSQGGGPARSPSTAEPTRPSTASVPRDSSDPASAATLAPFDSDDPLATSTPPPPSLAESTPPPIRTALFERTTVSTETLGGRRDSVQNPRKLETHSHSRIRAESFSELLELEATHQEGLPGGEDVVGPPGAPEMTRRSSFL
ncbi:hypothetical protein JCM11491_000117 [Sporobolomyces phaffii]